MYGQRDKRLSSMGDFLKIYCLDEGKTANVTQGFEAFFFLRQNTVRISSS